MEKTARGRREVRGPSRLRASLAEIAHVKVMRSGARLIKASDVFYRSIGLTAAQYNVLRILEGAGEPLSQQQIASRLLVSRANVTGLLDRLAEKKLIERLSCEDRRVNLIRLTPGGEDLLTGSSREVATRSGRLMRALTEPEQRELVRLLDKLEGEGN